MMSNSGFPFAPDYLNILRTGPPTEEDVTNKKGSKNKKRKSSEKDKSEVQSIKQKNVKSSSGSVPSIAAFIPTTENQHDSEPLIQPEVKHRIIIDNGKLKAAPINTNKTSREQVLSNDDVCSVLFKEDCPYSAIFSLSKTDTKAISGFCFVTLLKGQVNVNGYSLRKGVRTEIINPVWLPASFVHVDNTCPSSSSKKTYTTESIKAILTTCGVPLGNINLAIDEWISTNDCLVLIQGVSRIEQDWLLTAEDQSKYQEYSRTHLRDVRSTSEILKKNETKDTSDKYSNLANAGNWKKVLRSDNSDDIFGVVSAVVGEARSVSEKIVVDLLDISPTWITSVDKIIKDSSRLNCENSRTVICGAKGVGKSTCVRYTVNKLLSKTGAVAMIDCDLGQPECTVSGLLSLHIITEPILSPTHLHLKDPILSYFIGDITSKNEPDLFAKALYSIVEKYNQLQLESLEILNQSTQENNSTKNFFSSLSESTVIEEMVPLPLVVNTDGSVRYMGAEVLSAVMELIKPTYVMHISSEKDKDLPAIVKLRDVDINTDKNMNIIDNNTGIERNNNNTDKNNCSNGNKIKSINDSNKINITTNACEVFTLEPGRLKPSKIHSVDLRTLRIVSYFLRHIKSLKSKVRPEVPPPGFTPSVDRVLGDDTYMPKLGYEQSSSSIDINSNPSSCNDLESEGHSGKASKKSLALAAGEGFHIRRGALVDIGGAIAIATMGAAPLSVHISQVVLKLQCGDIPPRLVLAAMNASIVGILCRDHLPPGSSGSVQTVKLKMPSLACNESYDYEEESDTDEQINSRVDQKKEDIHIEIDYDGDNEVTSNAHPLPCIGLGIVRAIDIQKQLIYLITPVNPILLNEMKDKICLVRGHLQIPSIMMFAPDVMPIHPYMSSEVTGEGSTAMKARNNVKRRSQQN
mmetsp:Transcript_1689/g.1839  ORF Transcript_1689/g.1839 Transcript_1689/m.1839 type:complete len:916 (-) Transcript_1689:12-2759(-)